MRVVIFAAKIGLESAPVTVIRAEQGPRSADTSLDENAFAVACELADRGQYARGLNKIRMDTYRLRMVSSILQVYERNCGSSTLDSAIAK
jgi:hypothetical protein